MCINLNYVFIKTYSIFYITLLSKNLKDLLFKQNYSKSSSIIIEIKIDIKQKLKDNIYIRKISRRFKVRIFFISLNELLSYFGLAFKETNIVCIGLIIIVKIVKIVLLER